MSAPAPAIKQENPFPGLLPFDAGQSKYFYGRNRQIERILRHLEENRFLAVIGSSGCGKSSLVRAGVLPCLYRGYLGSGPNWRVAVMKPGGRPLEALADALRSPECFAANANFTLEELKETTRGLAAVAERLLLPSQNLLVLVDQFEEIFRFRRESEAADAEAVHFVELLLSAVSRVEVGIHIVLTMRTDYLSDCAQFDGLPEVMNRGQFLVPRLTRDERQQAIEGPLEFAGIPFAPRLVQQVLNDFGDEPNNLPVLQHALKRTLETWLRHNEDGSVDVSHYQTASTTVGAIETHCEQVYERLSPANRKVAARVFRCLTTVDRGRRVRRPNHIDVVREVAGPIGVDEVVDEFAREGFIVRGNGGVIDLTHESLILRWQRLKTWVDEEQLSARWYQKLADAARNGLSPWRGRELDAARAYHRDGSWTASWAAQYGSDYDEAMRFLQASGRLRTLRVAAALVVTLAIVIGTAWFIFQLNQEKERAEIERKRAERFELEAKSARDEAFAQERRTAASVATNSDEKSRLLQEAALFQENANTFKQQANAAAARPGAPAVKVEEQPQLATIKTPPIGNAASPSKELPKAEPAKTESAKAEPAKPDPQKQELANDTSAQAMVMGEYNVQPIKGWEGRAAIVTADLPTSDKSGSVYFVFNLIPSSPAQVLAAPTTDKSTVQGLLDRAEGKSNSGAQEPLRFSRLSISRDMREGVLERFRSRSGTWFTVVFKGFPTDSSGAEKVSLELKVDGPQTK
jgi:hypothetical protein